MSGQQQYQSARRRIPGGTQLLSKRPEMFLPGQWPPYYSRAKGAQIWDTDGRCYTDMSCCGIGACILGYADPDVDGAAHGAIDAGSMSTLNCAEEGELAELLCELHPWADMVRYARTGGEAMAVAVRIARARARRDKIAFCGYHGWHDWYLAANLASGDALDGHLLPGLAPAGVPRALAGSAFPFHYNRIEELEAIFAAHSGQIAGVVMEPVRSTLPEPGFLEAVRDLATRHQALLVFDEITSGWRMNCGGAHLLYGVTPDIAVFAKALSNGYPMAAILGTAEAMSAAQDTFISSTYWTERIGPAAALATLRKHRALQAHLRLMEVGERVQRGWRAAADCARLPVAISGIPPLSRLSFDTPDAEAVRTLFTQMMLDRGFLAGSAFYAMFAHSDEQIAAYLDAAMEVFRDLARAIETGRVRGSLRGPVAHSGFQRLA